MVILSELPFSSKIAPGYEKCIQLFPMEELNALKDECEREQGTPPSASGASNPFECHDDLGELMKKQSQLHLAYSQIKEQTTNEALDNMRLT